MLIQGWNSHKVYLGFDKQLDEFELRFPVFIKIDVDGGEVIFYVVPTALSRRFALAH